MHALCGVRVRVSVPTHHMNPEDLLRMIDVIHRDKDIPKEVIFRGLEEALAAMLVIHGVLSKRLIVFEPRWPPECTQLRKRDQAEVSKDSPPGQGKNQAFHREPIRDLLETGCL